VLAFPASVMAENAPDPFHQRVAAIELSGQTVVDGVAILSGRTGLSVSVEFPLGKTISAPAPFLNTFTVRIDEGTVSQAFDRLCALDGMFTWIRDGDTINIVPRAVVNDPLYFLNRKADELRFVGIQKADEAVMSVADQLPGRKEQIAFLQFGVSVNFATPWTATLKNVTVREALDSIAHQLGSRYGWQFTGAQDFRIITFYERLMPHPPKPPKGSGSASNP